MPDLSFLVPVGEAFIAAEALSAALGVVIWVARLVRSE